ncbi:MAG: hypothetical protein Q7T82_02675 [Armatimonadota bacterium]|nr:hypothetical protein [Armatimonadota bacterium]
MERRRYGAGLRSPSVASRPARGRHSWLRNCLGLQARRPEIKSIFRHFREVKVPAADFPSSHRGSAAWSRPGYSAYRYYFIFRDNCIHVVYDSQGKAVAAVPTYE